MAKRPKLFKNDNETKRLVQNLGNKLVDSTLNEGMRAVKESGEKVKAKKMPNYLQVTEDRMEKKGTIDLKPYFARSNKRKEKKDGGWYMVIPIQRRTRDMSRRLYDQLRKEQVPTSGKKTIVSDFLYDRRRESDATMLNYTPKSKTIEKRRIGKRRHSYVSFRTVSDKSPANSWIINRGNMTEENTSKTMIKNIDRLMKWKMKNGWM